MLPLDEITTDLLIIGAGGAGLMAALHARERDPREPRLIRTVWGGGYLFDVQPRDVE